MRARSPGCWAEERLSRFPGASIVGSRSPQAAGDGPACLLRGAELADVAWNLEVSEATYHRWRKQFGEMKAEDAKRLKPTRRRKRQRLGRRRLVAGACSSHPGLSRTLATVPDR